MTNSTKRSSMETISPTKGDTTVNTRFATFADNQLIFGHSELTEVKDVVTRDCMRDNRRQNLQDGNDCESDGELTAEYRVSLCKYRDKEQYAVDPNNSLSPAAMYGGTKKVYNKERQAGVVAKLVRNTTNNEIDIRKSEPYSNTNNNRPSTVDGLTGGKDSPFKTDSVVEYTRSWLHSQSYDNGFRYIHRLRKYRNREGNDSTPVCDVLIREEKFDIRDENDSIAAKLLSCHKQIPDDTIDKPTDIYQTLRDVAFKSNVRNSLYENYNCRTLKRKHGLSKVLPPQESAGVPQKSNSKRVQSDVCSTPFSDTKSTKTNIADGYRTKLPPMSIDDIRYGRFQHDLRRTNITKSSLLTTTAETLRQSIKSKRPPRLRPLQGKTLFDSPPMTAHGKISKFIEARYRQDDIEDLVNFNIRRLPSLTKSEPIPDIPKIRDRFGKNMRSSFHNTYKPLALAYGAKVTCIGGRVWKPCPLFDRKETKTSQSNKKINTGHFLPDITNLNLTAEKCDKLNVSRTPRPSLSPFDHKDRSGTKDSGRFPSLIETVSTDRKEKLKNGKCNTSNNLIDQNSEDLGPKKIVVRLPLVTYDDF